MSPSKFPACLFLAAAVVGTAAAQNPVPTVLVQTGDLVPTVGTITRIDDVSVNSLGDWIVEADTDAPTTE